MPATDPFSRASRASDGFDSGGLCAASEQSVGLASLPGFFSLVLALAGQNRLLLNARSPLLIGVRRIGGSSPRADSFGSQWMTWAAARASKTARHFRRIRPIE
jgi:hypothetical protein